MSGHRQAIVAFDGGLLGVVAAREEIEAGTKQGVAHSYEPRRVHAFMALIPYSEHKEDLGSKNEENPKSSTILVRMGAWIMNEFLLMNASVYGVSYPGIWPSPLWAAKGPAKSCLTWE